MRVRMSVKERENICLIKERVCSCIYVQKEINEVSQIVVSVLRHLNLCVAGRRSVETSLKSPLY